MENRGFLYCCIQYVFKNILSQIEILDRGIPFCKNQGFPKLSPWYVTNWGFPLQNVCYNQITVEYCGSDGPLEIFLLLCFSCVIICLYPKECNQLISKKTIAITNMCKLSFKVRV